MIGMMKITIKERRDRQVMKHIFLPAPSGFNMPEGGFTPTDMSALETASAAPSSINNAQRVALAGGNLDEAIALRSNAGSGLASLRQGAA